MENNTEAKPCPYEYVCKNSYGFYELRKKPTEAELSTYYSTYYQDGRAIYKNQYSEDEIKNIRYNLALKEYNYRILSSKETSRTHHRILDVGCGEGFFLAYFQSLGEEYDICGIDYNTFGCENHNPQVLPYLLQGDSITIMSELERSGDHFDYINLDNVLEHMINPKRTVDLCTKLLAGKESIVSISVPNDFSIIHRALFENEIIEKAHWVCIPDHISYFNYDGLSNLLEDAGLKVVHFEGTFPIDFNLFNPDTNYYADKAKGRNCHIAQIQIENLLAGVSIERLRNLYTELGALGVGRQIQCYCKLK